VRCARHVGTLRGPAHCRGAGYDGTEFPRSDPPWTGKAGGLGKAGRLGETPGFFIHAAIAVDADDEAVVGLLDARIWTRRQRAHAPRRQRAITAKESHRWPQTARRAGEHLREARQIIVVGDRENDMYAALVQRPANVELIIRAAQDRTLADDGKLFAAAQAWTELGQQTVRVPSRGPGDKGRDAVVGLRAGIVRVCRRMTVWAPVPPRWCSPWWRRARSEHRPAWLHCTGVC
jgi:hypothetical protein